MKSEPKYEYQEVSDADSDYVKSHSPNDSVKLVGSDEIPGSRLDVYHTPTGTIAIPQGGGPFSEEPWTHPDEHLSAQAVLTDANVRVRYFSG